MPNLSQLAGKMVMMPLLVLFALHSLTGCERTVEAIHEESVPFSTEYKKDSCLKPGEEIVEQEGKNGLAEIKIEKRFKGEKVISEREVSRVVIKEAVPKIVRRGEEKNIEFSRYKWLVKSGRGLGPGPNIWCSDNVEVDAKGHLHLNMTNMGTHNPLLDEWHCSEVRSENSFGYGEYRWSVKSGLSNLHPNVTLGLFTYLDDSHEIDFEFGRWGNSTAKNDGQFVVQPAADDSVHRFKILEEAIVENGFTISFIWRPDSIVFRCWLGEVIEPGVQAPLISEWRYNGRKIPKAGNERVHMNLWLIGGSKAGPKENIEVVLSGFGFTPLAEVKSTPVIRMWGDPSITVWVEDRRTVRGFVEGLTPDEVNDYEVRVYALTDIWYIQPYVDSAHAIDSLTMHFKTWTRLWYKLRADLIRKSTGEVIARDYYK